MSRINEILNQVQQHFEAKDSAREHSLPGSRKVVRLSAEAIRSVHREEYKEAEALLAEARATLREVEGVVSDHPDVFYAGFISDAQKEYAEAMITSAVVKDEPIPSPVELGIEEAAFLNGLAEAIGEIRRQIVDKLKTDQVERCVELLQIMDDFYSGIVSFDYPDALLPGLRRRTDVARSVIERTRHDVTTAIRQQRLEQSMTELHTTLGSIPGENPSRRCER